jgi:hypothetical protein
MSICCFPAGTALTLPSGMLVMGQKAFVQDCRAFFRGSAEGSGGGQNDDLYGRKPE